MKIAYTRAMIRAALDGKLGDARLIADPVFKVGIPERVPDVPNDVLLPRNTWHDKAAYDRQAKDLAGRFRSNFEQYSGKAAKEIAEAGPA
jgi:phosphoenolpyruvate carboxykinase (ATP)